LTEKVRELERLVEIAAERSKTPRQLEFKASPSERAGQDYQAARSVSIKLLKRGAI